MSPESLLEFTLGVQKSVQAFFSSWKPLGALLEALGAGKTYLGSALGRPEGTEETDFELPGGQIPCQKKPRIVPNPGPKAIRAENSDFFKNSGFLDVFL